MRDVGGDGECPLLDDHTSRRWRAQRAQDARTPSGRSPVLTPTVDMRRTYPIYPNSIARAHSASRVALVICGADGADGLDGTDNNAVLSAPKARGLGERFQRDVDAHYVEAKRSTVAGIAQVLHWMYSLLCVLPWNEALFNPLYFAFLLVSLAAACVPRPQAAGRRHMVVQLGLVGPLFQVLRTVGKDAAQI